MSNLAHRSKSQHQAITWDHRKAICPGCGRGFRTPTGLAWHLSQDYWAACARAHDLEGASWEQLAAAGETKAPKAPKRTVWQDKQYGASRREYMREIRGTA